MVAGVDEFLRRKEERNAVSAALVAESKAWMWITAGLSIFLALGGYKLVELYRPDQANDVWLLLFFGSLLWVVAGGIYFLVAHQIRKKIIT